MNAPTSEEKLDSQEHLELLLSTAKSADLGDRRKTERHPFFYPVNVSIPRLGSQNFSAFSRDISAGGMGLLSNMPFEAGPVLLTIMSGGDDSAQLAAEVLWCVPCGEGWYTSGVRFDHAAMSG